MGPAALFPLQREHMLRMFITHKNSLSSAKFEPAALGPLASTLITRPPRATHSKVLTGNVVLEAADNEKHPLNLKNNNS
jgi:hypothetical protein